MLLGHAQDVISNLSAGCCTTWHLQKMQRLWLLHRHLLTTGRHVPIYLAQYPVPVIRPEPLGLRFVSPSVAVASCDKLHLGWDASFPAVGITASWRWCLILGEVGPPGKECCLSLCASRIRQSCLLLTQLGEGEG